MVARVRVLAIDLSLAATGLVLMDQRQDLVVQYELVRTVKANEPYNLEARIHRIWMQIRRWAEGVNGIGLEALAPGATRHDNRPAQVYGVVTYRLVRSKMFYTPFTNNEVKQFATGNGNASKAQMVEAAKAAGFDPEGVPASLKHNLADAFFVGACWLERYS